MNVSLVTGGLLGQGFVLGGFVNSGAVASPQFFEQALVAQLSSITALAAILGTQADGNQSAIFKAGSIPQTWQYSGSNPGGPALSYSVPTKPKPSVLMGSDGTARARVQIDVFAFSEAPIKMALAAIFNSIAAVPPATWGDGSCVIVSVVHQDDSDSDEAPAPGSTQVLYHSFSEYLIVYRLAAGGG